MVQEMAGYWWVLLVRGIVSILFGLAALVWPGITAWALVVVFGVYVIIDGVLDIAMGIGGRGAGGGRLSGWGRFGMIALGLISVAAGIVAFAWPEITAYAIIFVIGVWAIVSGIVELITAWTARAELANEWMWVLAGLLSVALGVLLLAQPRTGGLAIVLWIGIMAIAWGLALCFVAFKVKGLGGPGADVFGPPPGAPA